MFWLPNKHTPEWVSLRKAKYEWRGFRLVPRPAGLPAPATAPAPFAY